VTLDAPKETRALPRINWLLRQLKDAPGDLRVEVAFSGGRGTTSLLPAELVRSRAGCCHRRIPGGSREPSFSR
jgi:hypothetical protein